MVMFPRPWLTEARARLAPAAVPVAVAMAVEAVNCYYLPVVRDYAVHQTAGHFATLLVAGLPFCLAKADALARWWIACLIMTTAVATFYGLDAFFFQTSGEDNPLNPIRNALDWMLPVSYGLVFGPLAWIVHGARVHGTRAPGSRPPTIAGDGLADDRSTTARSLPVKVFYSYSHKDETLRDKLAVQLAAMKREGLIVGWHDRCIGAGEQWKGQIDKHLDEAGLVLLLISPDFIASDYCHDVEMRRALERYDRGEAHVIPIILRPAQWQTQSFARLQCLPRDGKPITTWPNEDEAFLAVADGIRAAIVTP